ncbi:UvrD-like helicase, ATP-binding domain, P-loop containing nucleoside triphosphate hydrolase [Tanacetum coccineum]
MKQRTLTYAPTNVAIVELASRLLSEILKVSTDTEEIYLEHRIKRLVECLGPVTENEFLKEKQPRNEDEAWKDSTKKRTVGFVSPYVAQVVSIQHKLAHKYEKLDGFSVHVKSIDGFQGGEEDISILSTVRSNSHGHCLWILGNERTLNKSESIWKEIVSDARKRHCLFDADSDQCLKMTIIEAKEDLKQLDDLVNENNVLFKHAKWKVCDLKPKTEKLSDPFVDVTI